MNREQANEAFIREFQARAGLDSDGWAGSRTYAALDQVMPVAAEGPHSLDDASEFFAVIREKYGSLTKEQMEGYEFLLEAMAKWELHDTAYGLATAFWETNKTMQPVREAYWLSEDWRKKNLRYYPWYGRGYPQTTWKENYQRADNELGLGGSLMKNPDRMLEPAIAAATMVRGMDEGWFTGKKNSDYAGRDYVARRKMINGTDHDDDIAAVAGVMESALVAGGW